MQRLGSSHSSSFQSGPASWATEAWIGRSSDGMLDDPPTFGKLVISSELLLSASLVDSSIRSSAEDPKTEPRLMDDDLMLSCCGGHENDDTV